MKDADGSTLETHGSIETLIQVEGLEIPYSFQLLIRQIDLGGDGIQGRDVFKVMQAHICYKERFLTFQYNGITVHKKLGPPPGLEDKNSPDKSVNKLALPAKAEVIMRLPVTDASPVKEGLIERAELLAGVYLAESLVRVDNGHVITSVLITREEELETPGREIQMIELGENDSREIARIDLTDQDTDGGNHSRSRTERVVELLRTDQLPLTRRNRIIDQLVQSKYFTCLDMVMGYQQIELAQGEGRKTAFSTKQGNWEYQRLPFGLKMTRAIFQKIMNSVLSGLTGTQCFVYLDDIVIYAKSLADHNTTVREVLERIRRHKLSRNPVSASFCQGS